jgi:hypothetical protein
VTAIFEHVRTPQNTPCGHCGHYHGRLCPSVKAIEYYPDGGIKRVEYRDANPLDGTRLWDNS